MPFMFMLCTEEQKFTYSPNHLTSVPPLVRNCGVVRRELIITLKRTGDLAQ